MRRDAPVIQVLVGLSTLIGDRDEPAELSGYGPIPASLARLLAADDTGTWRRLVCDDLGRLIDYGRTRYRPPTNLDQFVRARDRHCVFPGCNRRADTADLDHLQPWTDDGGGGRTDADNLAALCPNHHHVKHDGHWRVSRDAATGLVTWISPTGHVYEKPPPDLPRAG